MPFEQDISQYVSNAVNDELNGPEILHNDLTRGASARVLTHILERRISHNLRRGCEDKRRTTYLWRDGAVNFRNLMESADAPNPERFWTNMKREGPFGWVGNKFPVECCVYVFNSWRPGQMAVNSWIIPKGIIDEAMNNLAKDRSGKYTIEIRIGENLIRNWNGDDGSPDLKPFFVEIPLTQEEADLMTSRTNVR